MGKLYLYNRQIGNPAQAGNFTLEFSELWNVNRSRSPKCISGQVTYDKQQPWKVWSIDAILLYQGHRIGFIDTFEWLRGNNNNSWDIYLDQGDIAVIESLRNGQNFQVDVRVECLAVNSGDNKLAPFSGQDLCTCWQCPPAN